MREHEHSFRCWCKPRFFETCLECAPFANKEAVQMAMAVIIPLQGIRAMRPKASKDCWKCGGSKLIEREKGEDGMPYIYAHNDVKESADGDGGSDADVPDGE